VLRGSTGRRRFCSGGLAGIGRGGLLRRLQEARRWARTTANRRATPGIRGPRCHPLCVGRSRWTSACSSRPPSGRCDPGPIETSARTAAGQPERMRARFSTGCCYPVPGRAGRVRDDHSRSPQPGRLTRTAGKPTNVLADPAQARNSPRPSRPQGHGRKARRTPWSLAKYVVLRQSVHHRGGWGLIRRNASVAVHVHRTQLNAGNLALVPFSRINGNRTADHGVLRHGRGRRRGLVGLPHQSIFRTRRLREVRDANS